MNLHKDKERLRHQRQVRLLDDVMKIVPRPLNGSASKIRKLRRLVLYYHFMKHMHAQITKGHSSFMKDSKQTEKKQLRKSPNKSVKVHCETKKKAPRANIVFLQADHSKNEKETVDEPILKDNGHYPGSSYTKDLEYEVPEVMVANNIEDNHTVIDPNSSLPFGNIVNAHSNNSSSPAEISLQSAVFSEDVCNRGKEEHASTSTNFVNLNSTDLVEEQLPMYDKARFPESIPISNESLVFSKHRKADFQNILQDYSNNSTLRDVTLPNIINENCYVTNLNFPQQDSGYVLEAVPINNISGYPVNLSVENVILGSNNVNYKPLCSFDSTMDEAQLHDLPSLPECFSDNCSSSTLTDNLQIDVENISDSSSECIINNSAGPSNDLCINNICGSSKTLIYDYPYDTLMNYDEFVLPFISPSHGFLENYNGQNEISFRPVGYLPHFDSISPNNVTFNGNPPLIQCLEPVHSFQDRFIEPRYVNDNVSFYSPSALETSPSERSLLNSKSEIKSEPDSQESYHVDNNPGLFDEEVSYPLSQYITNH